MRKRSSYRPRRVETDPLRPHRRVPQGAQDALMLRLWTAVEEVSAGRHPGIAEWNDLSDPINVVETLALIMRRLSIDEVMPAVRVATTAMAEAGARYKAGGGMRLSGPGLVALREVVSIYEACLRDLPAADMAEAIHRTKIRLIEARRRLERDPGAKVMML